MSIFNQQSLQNLRPVLRQHWQTLRARYGLPKILLASVFGTILMGILLLAVVAALLYPSLPELDSLTHYQPKIPLRVFSSDNALIAEFGEERRHVTPIKDIPLVMQQALLAVEDQHFYEHKGFYFVGNVRAILHNLTNFSGGPKHGASTISQQLARNFFLTNEQTYRRKLIEALLTIKIEKKLSKDEILELYMNQINLGHHAFGFAAAAQIYFGKNIKDISAAEAAMLAGIPKSPNRLNPISNFERAKNRQLIVLQLMRQMDFLTEAQYQAAKIEPLEIKSSINEFGVHAEYVAELARQAVIDEFKDETYTRGINVYTTIKKAEQIAAFEAVRQSVMEYDLRHGYRGAEGQLTLPDDEDEADDMMDAAFAKYPQVDGIPTAIILDATPKKVTALTSNGEEITMSGADINFVAAQLAKNANPKTKLARGAVIRVMQQDNKHWQIVQLPEVEAAFVAADTNTGAIRALVGGVDFKRNQFNHVTQMWRQPGSTFKPFIYSASLEKGLTPSTLINDQPLSFAGSQADGSAWEPKNSDGQFDGPLTMRDALAKSKNMVSIQILQQIGVDYGQQYAMKFGFDSAKNPANLTLALGSGAVTPLQMAAGYAAFANGGYLIKPYLITKITDAKGTILHETPTPQGGNEASRIITEGNAFMVDSLLKNVVAHGTAAKALSLNRSDIAGKTGTTNDAFDAWFAGYQNRIVAVAWIGFDQPKNLGSKEFGGGLALPVWIRYMKTALLHQPVEDRPMPNTLTQNNGDFAYIDPPAPPVLSVGMAATSDGANTNKEGEKELLPAAKE